MASLGRRQLLSMAAAMAGIPAVGKAAPGPLVQVVQRLRASIVALSRVEVGRGTLPIISGTGFVVGDGTRLITNAHVIDSADGRSKVGVSALVRTGTTLERRTARVITTVPQADLALLALDGAPLPPLQLRADAALVPEGTEIGIIGFPIGGALGPIPATHRGIIAAHAPNASPLADSRGLDPAYIRMSRFMVYQLDIVAYPGNSGSPVFLTDTGEVIGIINSTFIKTTKERALTDPSAISFAIPSAFAVTLLEQQA